MSRFIYTQEHLNFLRTEYMFMNVQDLTTSFNNKFSLKKTKSSIRSTLKNHKIRCGRKGKDKLVTYQRLLTDEQDRFLRREYKNRSREEMLQHLNGKFDIDVAMNQFVAYTKNHSITSGRTGFFQKGEKPWNTGTKGVMKPNSGTFKKGNIPPNRKPIGSERICPKDGFVLVKVAEKSPWTGFSSHYKHKHRHIWEQANGPIPDDKVVAFIDGNKTNCELNNLMLISRAELLTLNRHGYREMPEELKPTVLALSKLKVATRALEHETL